MEEEPVKVGGDQAMEVQNALALKMSHFEVRRSKCVCSFLILGSHITIVSLRKQILSKIVNLLSFMLPEESRKVYDLKQFKHSLVIFLNLLLNVGVSGNLVIGFA